MKWPNITRQMLIALAFGFLVCYQLNPAPSWACSAGGGAGFSYASQTSSSAVTVCAKSVLDTRTSAVAKPIAAPKPAPKPVAKPVAAPAPKPVAKPVAKPVVKVVLLTPIKTGVPVALQKPKVVAKPVAKPAPATPAKPTTPTIQLASNTSKASDEASFSPALLSVSASDAVVQVGEAVAFGTNAALHYKAGALLGKAVDVQFAPTETHWIFGDGSSSSGPDASHRYSSAGAYSITATVLYAVSYQIAGATSWLSSGSISVSGSTSVVVATASGQNSEPPALAGNLVRLVGQNCFENPGSFGCGP